LFTRNVLSPSLTCIAKYNYNNLLEYYIVLAMTKPEDIFCIDGGSYFGTAENPNTKAFLNIWLGLGSTAPGQAQRDCQDLAT
jgi:hypothetical protein